MTYHLYYQQCTKIAACLSCITIKLCLIIFCGLLGTCWATEDDLDGVGNTKNLSERSFSAFLCQFFVTFGTSVALRFRQSKKILKISYFNEWLNFPARNINVSAHFPRNTFETLMKQNELQSNEDKSARNRCEDDAKQRTLLSKQVLEKESSCLYPNNANTSQVLHYRYIFMVRMHLAVNAQGRCRICIM